MSMNNDECWEPWLDSRQIVKLKSTEFAYTRLPRAWEILKQKKTGFGPDQLEESVFHILRFIRQWRIFRSHI